MVAEHEAPHVGDMGEARNRIMVAFWFETFLWTAGNFFCSDNKLKHLQFCHIHILDAKAKCLWHSSKLM